MRPVISTCLSVAVWVAASALYAGPSELSALADAMITDTAGLNITLVEEGPIGNPVPPNLALLPGATPFAPNILGGVHEISDLNNGLYGNSDSWIGSSNPSFGGIALPASGGGNDTFELTGIAFGRDNTAAFSDRSIGSYTLQVTTVPNPSAATLPGDWTTIGVIDYTAPSGGDPLFTSTALRHRYNFDPVTASGFRILTQSVGNQLAIDEIELFGFASPTPLTPEPSTLLLGSILGLCGLSYGVWNRRRRAR